MSAASFTACVRAGRVPTRTELLDAADHIAELERELDALRTRAACLISEPGSADELREARAASERALLGQVNAEADAKRWAERVKALEARIEAAERALRGVT